MDCSSASREAPLSGSSKLTEGSKWQVPLSTVVSHFGTSGASVAAATGITHPLDVLKVRLQMQLVGQRGPLTGIGGLFVQLIKSEGPKSLYLGMTPAIIRSVLYGGLRLGLYEPSKYVCELAFESTNILVKIASGAFSGAVATALTNPVEVLKVRLQMSVNSSRGPVFELKRIVHEEGITALWKGVGPAMARAAALTASQLATYDETKQALIRWTPLEEGFPLHLISSTIAGAVSTLVTAPMDMVKTRLMLQQESKQIGMYRNGVHCAYQLMLPCRGLASSRSSTETNAKIFSVYEHQVSNLSRKVLRSEGTHGLYKGGLALFARLGPQTTITFILCEKLRELAGLKAI